MTDCRPAWKPTVEVGGDPIFEPRMNANEHESIMKMSKNMFQLSVNSNQLSVNAHAKRRFIFIAILIITALMVVQAIGRSQKAGFTTKDTKSTKNQYTIYNNQSSIESPSSFQNSGRAAPASAVFFDACFHGEYSIIKNAANRNGCDDDNFLILLAIRFSENGGPGREFGILHPAAIDTDLNTQAGWCAATIVKNRNRFEHRPGQEVLPAPGGVSRKSAEASGAFLDFLAERYCPKSVDPVGHKNWRRNVEYWFIRLNNLTTD